MPCVISGRPSLWPADSWAAACHARPPDPNPPWRLPQPEVSAPGLFHSERLSREPDALASSPSGPRLGLKLPAAVGKHTIRVRPEAPRRPLSFTRRRAGRRGPVHPRALRGLTRAATSGIRGGATPRPGQATRTPLTGDPGPTSRTGAQCFN